MVKDMAAQLGVRANPDLYWYCLPGNPRRTRGAEAFQGNPSTGGVVSCPALAGLRCATRWLPNGRQQFLLRNVVTELRKSEEPKDFEAIAVIASCSLTKDM